MRAKRWAEAESKLPGNKSKRPAVLGSVFDLGNYLNLADAEALKQVRAAHDEYARLCDSAGIQKANNRGPDLRARYLNCPVMESLHQLNQVEGELAFDSVREIFIEGPAL